MVVRELKRGRKGGPKPCPSTPFDIPGHFSAPAVIDLNVWHHAIHQVTGDMALCFNKATPADLRYWAATLQAVADEMTERADR